ncbi:hypothetical protein V1514DRAFT_325615 [Lipomyces japonicus]|uniref:uncharacterized protein n=1 Tax=Lipomyces japonicus TaxID=56871 RepID=UPI0034CF00D4
MSSEQALQAQVPQGLESLPTDPTFTQATSASEVAVAAAAAAVAGGSAANVYGPSGQTCTRCKIGKELQQFIKPSGQDGLYKFCHACRAQSRYHTNMTRRRRREADHVRQPQQLPQQQRHHLGPLQAEPFDTVSAVEAVVAAADGTLAAHAAPHLPHASSSSASYSPDAIEITNFETFVQLFPVPPDDDKIDPVHGPEVAVVFVMRPSVSLDGGVTTIGEGLRGLNDEPVDIFSKIVQSVYNISGYYFARRSKTRSSKTFRTQYVCSQVNDTSNARTNMLFKSPKRVRLKRPLYNCHGRMVLIASVTDLTITVKYTHRIIHGRATRRRYLPEIVKQFIIENKTKPMTVIHNGIKELGYHHPEIDVDQITRKQVYIFIRRLEEGKAGKEDLDDEDTEAARFAASAAAQALSSIDQQVLDHVPDEPPPDEATINIVEAVPITGMRM